MTVDASVPTNTNFGNELAEYIRENRVDINALWTAVGSLSALPVFSELVAAAAIIEVGTHCEDVFLEVVYISAAGPLTITMISEGREGMIKILLANGNNITLQHGAGFLELAGDDDINLNDGDSVWLINIDGDPDAPDNGYWREINRNLVV
jgi:hypothetical protein